MVLKQTCLLMLLLATLLLLGCATANLRTEYNKSVDFSQYKTFTVLPIPQHVQGAVPGAMIGMAPALEQTLRETLQSKGYTEAPAGEADFAVGIRGQIVPKTRVKDYGYYYPTGVNWASSYPQYIPATSVSQYEEGTLIVEIFDAKSKELAWVGWNTVKRVEGAPINIDRVQQGIREILGRFPPPPSDALKPQARQVGSY